MCGIAGYIGINPNDPVILKAMTDAISHRGPDGEGHYHAEDFAFGHRRLAIVDLSEAGKQPMHYKERYTITYNGEVYNYLELKEELRAAGYSFNSDSDTEVILASYDHWGVNCLNKFNGDWAFVLHDNVTRQYFIARDRFGIKPLYYYQDAEKFVFGSEVKAIYASDLVERAPNMTYLKQYLENGPNEYDAPTAFANIVRFPFAHYFLGTKEQLLAQPEFKRYWQLNVNEGNERFNAEKAQTYAEQYYQLLKDAVRLRMNTQVKVGAALSGGLDSSSIVYLMNEILKEQGISEPLVTFSSVYKSDGTQHCDESEFIDLVAKDLGVISHQIEPREENIPSEHSKMIWAMENPPDNTLMSSWHSFKLVQSKGFKVTLDGQGADEQLAGYLGYITSYFISIALIDVYRELLAWLKIPRIKKVLVLSFLAANSKYFLNDKAYQAIFFLLKNRQPPQSLSMELKKSLETDLVTLLHYADHTSAAFSIESRMPFMDHRLIEFLACVPASYKMHNGWTKYLARLAFQGKLPDDICWRKDKMGWPIPEGKWFEGGLNEWLVKRINNSELLKQLGIAAAKKNGFQRTQDLRKLNASFVSLFFDD